MAPEETETQRQQLDLLDALIANQEFMEAVRLRLTGENRKRRAHFFLSKWYRNGAISQITTLASYTPYSLQEDESDLGAILLIRHVPNVLRWDLSIFERRTDYKGSVIFITPGKTPEGETVANFTSISSPVTSNELGTELQTAWEQRLFENQLEQLRRAGLEIVQRVGVPFPKAT